jgi:putative ATPase
MPEVEWYRPTDRGLEARIREKLEHLRALDAQAGKKRKR